MPNIVFPSLEQVPDEFKSIAKDAGDGKVTINVVAKATVDEFRDKNIALSKERDELLTANTSYKAVVGDDIEGFGKNLEDLRSTKQRVVDGELKETRQIEEALGKRTDEMRKDYDKRLQDVGKEVGAWKGKYETRDAEYRRSLVASAIKDAAMETDSGVQPGAVEDIINTAYGTFRAGDDGKVTPFDGDAPIYGADGFTPMTPKEYIAKLKERKPHYFKLSNGGGAGGETTKKVHGVDRKTLAGMSAADRLALANERPQ